MTLKRTQLFLFVFASFLIGCNKNQDENPPTQIYYDPDCDPSEMVENTHTIEGYSDSDSYLPGDSVHLMIHSTTEFCDISLIRHGLNDDVIETFTDIPCFVQNYNCRSYTFGCKWANTFSFKLPIGIESGIYSAELTNDLGELFNICFVVKGHGSVPFVVLANTNTWQAYNDWSGQSFYTYGLNEEIARSEIISFDRPNIAATPYGNKGHLTEAELHLHRWMEDNNYAFDVIADQDLHDGSIDLNDYQTIVLNVHPEYWTQQMRDRLEAFQNNGGNIINLGANCIYWKTAVVDRRMEKLVERNSFFIEGNSVGGLWRNNGFPESEMLGVEYDRRGYNTYYPYATKNASHWIFNGTGLSNEDLFGDESLNGGGASGHETDKMTLNSPPNTIFLAKGTNPESGGATMCYYQHIAGGHVFSAGSITFTGSLTEDPICHQIAKNVFDNFQ